MARTTVNDDITRLETELADLRQTIASQKAVGEMEEGGAGSRFRTTFTPLTVLLKERDALVYKLETLYNYKDRI